MQVSGVIKCPDDAYYVKAVGYNDATDYHVTLLAYGIVKKINDVALKTKNLVQKLNIFCIGDSLTRGVIDSNVQVIKESYPYWVGEILNSTIINAGYPGGQTTTWWNDKKTAYGVPTKETDVILIMFGTNGGLTEDTLSTDVEPYSSYEEYADTGVGCMCKIIEWCMEQTENHAQIILMTPPLASPSANKNSVITATNPVVKAIAQRYALPVIDVCYECGMNTFNGDVFRSNDGLHFNAKGYHKLGSFIAHRIVSMYSTFAIDDMGTVIS